MSGRAASPPNVVERLYDAFSAHDWRAMEDCYAEDATFRDPVFELRGADRIGALWQMLIEGDPDLVVVAHDITADDIRGSARWEAYYTFGGRKVHNVIEASFALDDGLIVGHVDRFPFWRWARQALGPTGLVLGWSGWLRRRVRTRAMQRLEGRLGRG